MNKLAFDSFLYQEGRLSLVKAAMLCSTVSNDMDELLVEYLLGKGIRAVITRAGGSGDNLKSKILRNAFGAAEKSGLLAVSPKNRHAVTRLVEDLMRTFESPLMDVAGGGIKIGLAISGSDLAMAIYGNLGIPGMEVDFELSAARALQHYLDE